jgi:hypothetical protein
MQLLTAAARVTSMFLSNTATENKPDAAQGSV